MTDYYTDPFGAPEFLITGVKREMICTELLRMCCYANEGGEKILRVKLLMPMQMLILERQKLAAFMSSIQTQRLLQAH